MSVISKLQERLSSAEMALNAVRQLERSYRRNQRVSSAQFKSIAAMRAAVNVMIYNSIEGAIREAFANVRMSIQAENVRFSFAKDFWQHDCLRCAFLEKMQNGTNHGNLLGAIVPQANTYLSWDEDRINEMPTSGNFGQDSAIYLRDKLPLNWNFPANTAGGVDLEAIRNNRNDLSHGFESFVDIGNLTDTDTLHDSLRRIRQFMTSMIEAIERYQTAREYIR